MQQQIQTQKPTAPDFMYVLFRKLIEWVAGYKKIIFWIGLAFLIFGEACARFKNMPVNKIIWLKGIDRIPDYSLGKLINNIDSVILWFRFIIYELRNYNKNEPMYYGLCFLLEYISAFLIFNIFHNTNGDYLGTFWMLEVSAAILICQLVYNFGFRKIKIFK